MSGRCHRKDDQDLFKSCRHPLSQGHHRIFLRREWLFSIQLCITYARVVIWRESLVRPRLICDLQVLLFNDFGFHEYIIQDLWISINNWLSLNNLNVWQIWYKLDTLLKFCPSTCHCLPSLKYCQLLWFLPNFIIKKKIPDRAQIIILVGSSIGSIYLFAFN